MYQAAERWRKSLKPRRKLLLHSKRRVERLASELYSHWGEQEGTEMRLTQSYGLCFSTNISTAVMRFTKQTRRRWQMGLTRRHLFHKSRNWLAGTRPDAVEVLGVCAATAAATSAPSAASCSTRAEITASPCSTVTTHCATTAQLGSWGGARTRAGWGAPSVDRPRRSRSGRSGGCRRSHSAGEFMIPGRPSLLTPALNCGPSHLWRGSWRCIHTFVDAAATVLALSEDGDRCGYTPSASPSLLSCCFSWCCWAASCTWLFLSLCSPHFSNNEAYRGSLERLSDIQQNPTVRHRRLYFKLLHNHSPMSNVIYNSSMLLTYFVIFHFGWIQTEPLTLKQAVAEDIIMWEESNLELSKAKLTRNLDGLQAHMKN